MKQTTGVSAEARNTQTVGTGGQPLYNKKGAVVRGANSLSNPKLGDGRDPIIRGGGCANLPCTPIAPRTGGEEKGTREEKEKRRNLLHNTALFQ